MSNFRKKDVIVVNAQALSTWRHKLNSGQIGRWIAEKLFSEYSDRMDILRAIDEQLRAVALGNNIFKMPVTSALAAAQQALSDNRYIDAAYYVSIINEIAVEVIMEGKDTIDQLKYIGKEYLARTENDEAVNYFPEDKKEAEAQMLQNLYKKFFGHPMERAYAKEIAARKKSVEKMVNSAGAFVQQMLAMFDQMGMARASGRIENWVAEFEKFAKSQPTFQNLINNTYNNSIKDLVGVARQANKLHDLGQEASYEYLSSIYGQVAQPPAEPKQKEEPAQSEVAPVVEAPEEQVAEEIDPETQQKINDLPPEEAAVVVTLMKSIHDTGASENYYQDGNGHNAYVDNEGNVVFETIQDESGNDFTIPLNKIAPALTYAESIGLLGPKPQSSRVVPMGPNTIGPSGKPIELGPIPKELPSGQVPTEVAPTKTRKPRTPKVKPVEQPQTQNPMIIPVEQGVKDYEEISTRPPKVEPVKVEQPAKVQPKPAKPSVETVKPEVKVETKPAAPVIAPGAKDTTGLDEHVLYSIKKNKLNLSQDQLDFLKTLKPNAQRSIISNYSLSFPWEQSIENARMIGHEIPEYNSSKAPVQEEPKKEVKKEVVPEKKEEPKQEAPVEPAKEEVEDAGEPSEATYGTAKATVNKDTLNKVKKDIATYPTNSSIDASDLVAVVFNPKTVSIKGEDQMEAAIKALSDAFGKDVVLFSQSDLSGFQSHVKKWKRDNVPFSMVAWEDPSLVTFDKASEIAEEPEGEPSDDEDIENEINQKMRSASVVDQIVLKLSHQRFFDTLKKCANKYDAATLMLKYSYEMENEDQEMSTKLLARAQELLND